MMSLAGARSALLHTHPTLCPGALNRALWVLSRGLSSTGEVSSASHHDRQQSQGGAHPAAAAGPAPPPPPLTPPPIMPAAAHQQQHQHWLDKHFPGVRLWLEDKMRHWWIKGVVEARSKQYHQLEGREQELRRLIEAEYRAAMQQYGGRAVDERAETHLQVAALALATHKTLLPWLRDEQEVLQIIREHMGGRTTALLRFLMRATKFLHRDGYATLAARLRGLQWDMGAGFDSQLQLGQDESSLTITRCFYHDLFEAAGQPQLSTTTCCSQDQVWFETPYRGVQAGRTSAISAGDLQCCFVVRRQQPVGQR